MAQVKIYALKGMTLQRKQRLSGAIHEALGEIFQLPEGKRFQRFILLDKEDFLFPEDRSDAYMIIELLIFEGRTAETKKELVRALIRNIKDALDVSVQDMEITIIETPRSNWGIRGVPGDELEINYRVEI